MARLRVGVGAESDLFGLRAAFRGLRWPGRLVREDWLAAAIAQEREARRPFLFVPVGLIGGVLLYFAAEREPSLWAPLVLLGLAGLAAFAAYRRQLFGLALLCLGLACLAAGFSAATLKARLVAAPILDRAQAVKGTGIILEIDRRGEGARLLIGLERLHHQRAEAQPHLIRLTSRTALAFEAGARIEFSAYVMPPPQASRPGGYDFAREAWFSGLGAVGSLQGKPVLSSDQTLTHTLWRWRSAIDRARNDVTDRIVAAIGGQAGEVAAALITGKRGGISEETNEILRAAGIYHVVSISGLHMVLAAGMVFVLVRALFALSPAALLVLPVKSIAAVAAMGAACAYNVFAGSEVATERSLVMTLIMLAAILFQRRAISMRNLALAAIILVLFEPETVIGPSFQMSFCAVMGLVALYERTGMAHAAQEGLILQRAELPSRETPPPGLVARLMGWVRRHAQALVLTTLVAELTTTPFGIYHFQQMQPLGLIGNALVLPLISALVMPAALLGMIALPFGLDGPVWWLMGLGVAWMIWIAGLVAALPFAIVAVPAPQAWAIGAIVLGVIWVALWHSLLRWAGLVLIAFGFAFAWSGPRPDLYVSPDGKSALLRGPDGRLAILGGSPGRFRLEQWLRADGDQRAPDDPSLQRSDRCDPSACILYDQTGYAVSLIKDQSAFEEDCQRARLIVTALPAPANCRNPGASLTLIDAEILKRMGAVEAYRTGPGQWRLTGSRPHNAQRLWHPPVPRSGQAVEDKAPAPNAAQ
jgi:competence protein ComEC